MHHVSSSRAARWYWLIECLLGAAVLWLAQSLAPKVVVGDVVGVSKPCSLTISYSLIKGGYTFGD